ncbi:MAG: AAA family ATPase [candidate division WOR-3 bacterium]
MRDIIFDALEELLEQPINKKLDESEILNFRITYKEVKGKSKVIIQEKNFPYLLPHFVLEVDERRIFKGYYKFSSLNNHPVPYKPFLRFFYKTDKFKFLRTIQQFKNDISIYYSNGPRLENQSLEEFFQKTLFPNEVFENKILIIEIFHSNKINKEIFKEFRILKTLKKFAEELNIKLNVLISNIFKKTGIKFKSLIGFERLFYEIEEGTLFLSRIYDKFGYLLHFRPKSEIKEFFVNKSQGYILNVFACNGDYSDGTIKSFDDDPYLPNWTIGIMHIFEDNLEIVNEEIEKFLKIEKNFYINNELSEYSKLVLKYKNVILYGPPGVGKTYIAIKIAKEISKRNWTIVQLHPSYSYEDFMEGIRPKSDGGFYVKDGVFKQFCKNALNSNDNFVIILDEMSRCNVIQVFGELLYALEYRNKPIILPYSNESFSIPENVYIIGTMNSADRSVHNLDIALRRRFIFIEILPDFNVIKEFYIQNNYSFEILEKIEKFFSFINDLILKKLGSEFLIGHSYFLVEPSEIKNIIKFKILPVLVSILSKDDYKKTESFLKEIDLY